MHLWVTRPIEDAAGLRAQLIAQGHEVTTEALIGIEYFRDEVIDLEHAQALIATSRNALRALKGHPAEEACKTVPIFVVGRATARLAEEMGFETVIEGPSTARALLGLILNAAEVNDGALIHLSAENVAYNLCEELRRLGYHVFQPILYRSQPVEVLSETLQRNLRSERIDGVLLLSGRTAEAYATAMIRHGLLEVARNLTHFCLSDAVAARLSPLQPVKLKISAAPNLDEMLAMTASSAAN
jgi:uroporphyrinogen-III synthase